MALIKCPECDNSISSLAPACPHCGAPVSRPAPPVPKGTSPWTVIGWIIVLILVAPLATCFLGIAGSQFQDYQKRVDASHHSP